jgi:hypothetical protein
VFCVRGLETLLFWLMMVAGAAVLAPCLILPAWLEHQAQLERRLAAETYVTALQFRLDTVQKQIEHLRNDPAYVMRLAQQEFGRSIDASKSETILIEPSPDEGNVGPPVPAALEDPNNVDEFIPELSAFLEQVVRRYPRADFFVNDRTRPYLMGTGGVLMLTAVLLLGRAGVRR